LRLLAAPAALFVLALLRPVDVSAQIVNTLRGFDADRTGWAGEVGGSFSRSGGNTDVLTLSAGGGVQWQGERNRWRLLGDVTLSESDGERDEESTLGHLRHNFRLAPRVATLAFVQIQENPFQRLKSRFLAGAGLRFDLLRREDLVAAAGAAPMVEVERIEERSGSDTDLRLSTFLSIEGRLDERTSVDLTSFVQPLAEDFADLRATVEASLRLAVTARLSVVASLNLTHDTEPPDDVEKTDWKTRNGLTWKL
jgi:putative salt-induced outer membrane protein YdiY